MNRTQYRKARRMCRDNGRYALRWLPAEHARIMDTVMYARPIDQLAERVDTLRIIGYGQHLIKSMLLRPFN